MAAMTHPVEHLGDLLGSEGFLDDPLDWTEDVAISLAQCDGLPELTRDHWLIIRALREHFQRFGTSPPAFSHLCNKHHLGRHCVERLFRSEREAWRIAGLPDPGEEAKTYMQ
ncbi:MAG: TusE/DsrC/DsvC family sulfur relay protein [Gammaproteobacteria bacterium]